MKIITLAIDLAKDVFQLQGVDEYGKPLLRKQVRRGKLAETVQNIPTGKGGCRGEGVISRASHYCPSLIDEKSTQA